MNKNNSSDNQSLTKSVEALTELSHHNARAFRIDKLKPPRDYSEKDWQWIHDSDEPLILEIGAGKGKHAISYADNHPNTNIIAVERTLNKFQAFSKSVEDLNELKNLYPVHADVIAWSVFALPPKSLKAVFILYPNPEPSNPNQRWLNMPFFEFLLSRLVDGGQIIMASNIISYIDNAEKQATELWQLPTVRESVSVDSQRTHFEVKYLARGEKCEQLIMRKPRGYVTRFD